VASVGLWSGQFKRLRIGRRITFRAELEDANDEMKIHSASRGPWLDLNDLQRSSENNSYLFPGQAMRRHQDPKMTIDGFL